MASGRSLAAVLVGSIAVFAHRSDGALLAYEGFDYTPTNTQLQGRTGGTGFSGSWALGGFNASLSGNYTVQPGSLSYGPLLTDGERASSVPTQSISGITRSLQSPLGTPIAPTTRYISFLVRPEGTLGAGVFNGFFGLVLENPIEPELYIGKPGGGNLNQFVLEQRGGGGQIASGGPLVVGQTSLLVLKTQLGSGNDTATLYINPPLGGGEPPAGLVIRNADFGHVPALSLYSTGAFSMDELRIGHTFADVTPVPEPGVISLLLASALALTRRRRC